MSKKKPHLPERPPEEALPPEVEVAIVQDAIETAELEAELAPGHVAGPVAGAMEPEAAAHSARPAG
jgi:hypothetical protein